jgi:hypothetical protein
MFMNIRGKTMEKFKKQTHEPKMIRGSELQKVVLMLGDIMYNITFSFA